MQDARFNVGCHVSSKTYAAGALPSPDTKHLHCHTWWPEAMHHRLRCWRTKIGTRAMNTWYSAYRNIIDKSIVSYQLFDAGPRPWKHHSLEYMTSHSLCKMAVTGIIISPSARCFFISRQDCHQCLGIGRQCVRAENEITQEIVDFWPLLLLPIRGQGMQASF